jgi:hypothetical protein
MFLGNKNKTKEHCSVEDIHCYDSNLFRYHSNLFCSGQCRDIDIPMSKLTANGVDKFNTTLLITIANEQVRFLNKNIFILLKATTLKIP